jgi:hypothetical protein
MRDVQGGEDTPATINLRVIAIDFGHDQEDRCQKEGHGKTTDEWVCRQVDAAELIEGPAGLDEPPWQRRQFRDIR